jgi:hypothetical protein
MLSTDKIKTYFKKFVKNLSTFKENKLHNALIDYIINTYIDDSYKNIPLNHKIAYEDQVIPEEWYDTILLSNGFTKDIVSTISRQDKFILLQMFLDFNRYKGSVDQMIKVAYAFEDRLNLYELLLDQRDKYYTGHKFTFYNSKNYVSCHSKIILDSLDIGDFIYPGEDSDETKLEIIDKQIIDFGEYTADLDYYSERNLTDSMLSYKLSSGFDMNKQLMYNTVNSSSYGYFKLNLDNLLKHKFDERIEDIDAEYDKLYLAGSSLPNTLNSYNQLKRLCVLISNFLES